MARTFRRGSLVGFFALTSLAGTAAFGQGPTSAYPTSSGVAVHAVASGTASVELSVRQVELVETVSAYFNQMSSLEGEFVQTSAGRARLRGKFYVQRPGRFRFDYARPSRLVIVSDGRQVAVQDHDLKSDDRWALDRTPLGVLLREDVNLLRDARFFDVQERDDAIVIAFEDKNQGSSLGPLRLFLSKAPKIELKKWTSRDLQGAETEVELRRIARVENLEPELFKPPAMALDRWQR